MLRVQRPRGRGRGAAHHSLICSVIRSASDLSLTQSKALVFWKSLGRAIIRRCPPDVRFDVMATGLRRAVLLLLLLLFAQVATGIWRGSRGCRSQVSSLLLLRAGLADAGDGCRAESVRCALGCALGWVGAAGLGPCLGRRDSSQYST